VRNVYLNSAPPNGVGSGLGSFYKHLTPNGVKLASLGNNPTETEAAAHLDSKEADKVLSFADFKILLKCRKLYDGVLLGSIFFGHGSGQWPDRQGGLQWSSQSPSYTVEILPSECRHPRS
jgi:hypothetical protein